MLRGETSPDELGARAASERRASNYRLLSPSRLLFGLRPRVRVLRVSHWLRFGNSVKQLINVFLVADQLNAEQIQFPQPHPFFASVRAGNFNLSWGTAKPTSPALEGEFFNSKAFRLKGKASNIARVVIELVRPMLAETLRSPDPRVQDSDLVLHFRGGDVFRQTMRPHPLYAQPPLSFYLSVVEREGPNRVWLVFEDRSNPCVEAAASELKRQGYPVILQSGTLAEDIRVLLSATRFASARGTFGEMIAHLSHRLQRAYFFERPRLEVLRRLGIEAILAKDVGGEFTSKLLSNNWEASPEQQAMLLSYPANKLSFELPSLV